MTLEGANLFYDATDYAIYAMNSQTSGQYCAVLPKNNTGVCNMLVDLHMKNAFDGLTNGSKTKEQVIEEIKNEYNGIKSKYQDGILVIPMLDENLYASAVINNDEQKMGDKVKKIGGITKEIYNKLINSGIEKEKIDQKIIIIIKNNDDIKFVDWLKSKMPDFVIGVNLSDLQALGSVNPFENNNPFMASSESVNPVANNIVEPTQNQPVDNNLFATPQETTPTSAPIVEPVQPVVEQRPSAPVETPAVQQPVGSVPPVTANQNPEPSAPTPVQSTPLEATVTMPPVQPNLQNQVTQQPSQPQPTNIPAKKGSKGFTNLLILLVILVGVTFISIELGKYLYNTYGV